jgi:hypothetical protein
MFNIRTTKQAVRYLALMTLLASPLAAEEAELGKGLTSYEREGEERHAIGSRPMTLIAEAKMNQARLNEFIENQGDQTPTDEQNNPVTDEPNNNPTHEEATRDLNKPILYAGAIHYLYAYAWDFSWIELEDGTVWDVRWEDRNKITGWLLMSDNLYVTQGGWFSKNYYKIVNQSRGIEIEVDLKATPIVGGSFTRTVIYVDYKNGLITLNDGTIWNVLSNDNYLLSTGPWCVNDIVVVGLNSDWYSGSYPFILINGIVGKHHYVRIRQY